MTPSEKAFVEAHPFEALNAYAQAQKSIASTWKYFGRNGEDDESDAFRHFVWAGLLTQQLGETMARDFLDAHEQLQKRHTETESRAKEMDTHNNNEGIAAAKQLEKKGELTLTHLETLAYEAIKSGKVRVISSKGKEPIYPVGK